MNDIEKLVGTTIKKIFINQEYLRFETDKGSICFSVEGDCCSYSYFYDFHGVKKLLKGNKVVSAQAIDLDEPDDEDSRRGDVVSAYGFEIVTKDPKFGEVTSVLSFRNDSNGYYGGWMSSVDVCPNDLKEITDDILEV